MTARAEAPAEIVINHRGRAEVIVALVVPEAPLSSDSKERIDRVLASLQGEDFLLRNRWDALSAFSGLCTKEGLARLAQNPGVWKVGLDSGGFQVTPERLELTRYDRVAILDAGLPSGAEAELSGSVDLEACFCGTAEQGCCPDGSSRQTGAGSAREQGDFASITGLLHEENRKADQANVVGLNVRAVVVKLLNRQGRLPAVSSVISALDYLAEQSDVTVSSLVFGFITDDYYCGDCASTSASSIVLNRALARFRSRGLRIYSPADSSLSPSEKGLPGCLGGVRELPVPPSVPDRELPEISGTGVHPVPRAVPMGPANPGPLPSYLSTVMALVHGQAQWPAGAFPDNRPLAPDRAYSSLDLEILAWRPELKDQPELLQPRQRLEAFFEGELPSDLIGRQVRSLLRFRGDTRGVRWFLSSTRIPACELKVAEQRRRPVANTKGGK